MFDKNKKPVDLDTLTEYHRQLVSVINTSNSGNQVSSMPTANASFVGKVVQYAGTTNANYIKGYFYECVNNNGTYSWVQKNVQDGGSGGGAEYPSGGTTGQALVKKSNADNDVEWGDVASDIDIDSALSTTSENPVQNKVIKTALDGKVDTSSVGVANGVAGLDSTGKVPSTQLPSFSSLELGETSTTAYRGDRGKAAYDDSQANKTAIGTLSSLTTTNKSNLVSAINEVAQNSGGTSDFEELTNRPVEGVTSIDDIVTPLPNIIINNKVLSDDVNCVAAINRWLRFDPSNKKGLIIKAGTFIRLANGSIKEFKVDTAVDLTSYVTTAGADYFVYLADDSTVSAYTTKQSDKGVYIGRFHTLCVNVGTINMIAPASANSGLTTSNYYLIKSYDQEKDPDFYAFYNKQIKSVSANAKYNVVTVEHPLSGFTAGSILPESIFCLTWKPDCLYEDAMVYDKNTDIAVDVYLQSGTGEKTRSKYNATHTVNREAENHFWDLQQVGKKPLTDFQFTSIALGSNECTNIVGSSDKGTVGGHADTAGRRMISAIGVEEACGYIWQWLENLVGWTDSNWNTRDGRASFGQEYGDTYVLLAGGAWSNGSPCGSRCRGSHAVRSHVDAFVGSRGSSLIKKGAC